MPQPCRHPVLPLLFQQMCLHPDHDSAAHSMQLAETGMFQNPGYAFMHFLLRHRRDRQYDLGGAAGVKHPQMRQ